MSGKTFMDQAIAPAAMAVFHGAISPAGQEAPPRSPSPQSKEILEHLGREPDEPHIIEETTLPPKTSFTWADVITLLQAGHNPRFCRSMADAHAIIDQGGSGDSCALIGGFSYIVGATLPKAFGAGRDGSNMMIAAVMGDYLQFELAPSLQQWKKVEGALLKVAPTPVEQALLCKAWYDALHACLAIMLKTNNRNSDVAMIMVKAANVANDRGPLYGPLGKVGVAKYRAFWDVSPQIFHALDNAPNESAEATKVATILNGVVVMAQGILKLRPLKE